MKLYFLQHIETKELACLQQDAFDDMSVIDHNPEAPIFCHLDHSEVAAVFENNHWCIWSTLNKRDYQIIERVV
ncbi:hypothetical protein IPAKJDPM_00116 [Aeromonas phage avDM14-QBC]|nr:hypothetical protein IPAKJDPM_00116 [Aeromonas phage avDM14-QBC]UYD58675.1 hypothetical protein HNNIDBEH_00082 [Aeromonas phage avDM10-HWA]UYD59022.1 hypothetical protein OFOPOMKI_00172 [Aeromonas phage avDM7-IJDJ]